MLTYLEETYTPSRTVRFPTSEAVDQWIQSNLAPNIPITDAFYLDEGFELNPVTDMVTVRQTKSSITGQESRIIAFTCDGPLESLLDMPALENVPICTDLEVIMDTNSSKSCKTQR